MKCTSSSTNATPVLCHGHRNKLETPSLEVAPTTLWLTLLIYSFHFRSAFLPRCRKQIFQFNFQPTKGHFASCELSPITLTNGNDPERDKMNHQAKYLHQRSFHWHLSPGHTHTEPTNCTVPHGHKVVGNYLDMWTKFLKQCMSTVAYYHSECLIHLQYSNKLHSPMHHDNACQEICTTALARVMYFMAKKLPRIIVYSC